MQSAETSPIRGFDKDGNPVSAAPRSSPEGVVTRREAILSGASLQGLLPDPVRTNRPGWKSTLGQERRHSLLQPVPEHESVPSSPPTTYPVEQNTLQTPGSQHSIGSNPSLAWDESDLFSESSANDTGNNSRHSVSTRFSVPLSFDSIDSGTQERQLPSPDTSSDDFQDLSNEDDNIFNSRVNLDFLDEELGEERLSRELVGIQSINQPIPERIVVESTMAEIINQHKENLMKVRMMYEDDLEGMNLEEVTVEYIRDKMKSAEQLKTLSQAAIVHLGTNDAAFIGNPAAEAAAVKKKLIDFVKTGQKFLKSHQNKLDAQVPAAAATDLVKDATRRIKLDRVTTYEAKTLSDLNNVVDEYKVLLVTVPNTDADYKALAERHVAANRRAELLLRDARLLRNDAVESGMEIQAKSLESGIRELQDTQLEMEQRLHEHKIGFGLLGATDTAKSADIELPTFSGESGDKLDYYSFKSEFEDYLKTKNYSTSEKLRVLQRSALKGIARDACLNMTDALTIWNYLLQTYGNVRILLANKIEEIRKIGGCTGSNLKMREWSLMIKSKLTYVHDLAAKHSIQDELYFSPILQEIQVGLPTKIHDDFKARFKKEDRTEDISRRSIFLELLDFLDTITVDLTVEINYEMTSLNLGRTETVRSAPTHKPQHKPYPPKKAYISSSQQPKPSGFTPGAKPRKQILAQGTSTTPQEQHCDLCNGKHTFLQYCEEFQKCRVRERYKIVARVKVCFRCLRLDSGVGFNDREKWWDAHKSNCRVSWECKQGKCAGRQPSKQYHFLLCSFHISENKDIETDYIKSLNQSLLKPGVRFFYNAPYSYHVDPTLIHATRKDDGYQVLPDVDEPSIFMLQIVTVDRDKKLLLFYDSGCMGASLSSRAVELIETETVTPGPTFMSVAGGQVIKLETGEQRFWLVLADGARKATLTGLEMPNITTPFPTWDLQEAWEDVQRGYKTDKPMGELLPPVTTTIGGCAVDVMIGIRYHAYFPVLVYTLPCGLGVYRSRFASENGRIGILGGPHKTWRNAKESSHVLGPRAYFTAEARAYFQQGFILRRSFEMISSQDEQYILNLDMITDEEVEEKCIFAHCLKHCRDSGWMVPTTWDLTGTKYVLREDSPKFSEIEALGTETSYRCIRCRNCNDCRKGEILERVSLQEETEQALIENSVSLIINDRKLEAKLPFILDPLTHLTPNRHTAEKILESQLRLVSKHPEMLLDTIKSHNKLRLKGHVIPFNDLTVEEKNLVDSTPGPGYYIPWRTVYKERSLSTPCRMVFDASSRTPHGGESLNNILAKGQNKLARILSILLRFRRKRSAMTADVSMAYNGVKLHIDHYKYQRYLWREELNPENPLITMIVRTLIYGVRPSGNQTMAAFVKLSDHCKLHHPEHSSGADVLAEDAYMDDILHSEDSPDKCRFIAESLDFTLNLGSMSVKAYTFAGSEPSELVSGDGENVGLVGMLWKPAEDIISIDVKELYLGKARRGKLPELVQGDVGEALIKVFTRRVVVGKIAGLFDPMGLVTPVSARFKLNLHELCKLNLDWDDKIPDIYLETWVKNLEDIQKIREVRFRRSVVPPDAANLDLQFITSVDASEKIAIAVVHSRTLLTCGSYYTQLVCAKSKIVSTSTIPRAELKAATMGAVLSHTVKVNFAEQFKDSLFVTDSTVALYWINQDQRLLQVGVRNAVIEIRRFTQTQQWFHVDTNLNIADLGTRTAEVEDLDPTGAWQSGTEWMRLERNDMPLRTCEDITLTSEERRIASKEIKAPDIAGIVLSNLVDKVGSRYSYSKYLVDPCVMSWPKSVRVLAYVLRFISKLAPDKSRFRSKLYIKSPRSQRNPIKPPGELKPNLRDFQLSEEEIGSAERYFFLKTTSEVKQFSRERDWKDCTLEKDGILYYSSRILDGQELVTVENSMWDLEPLSFVKPVVDRFSPVAYAVMGYTHAEVTKHRNTITTLRESRNLVFVLQGRDLSNELRESCVSCRRFKAKLLEVELGKVHENRLTIAPAFYQVQVDLLGPFTAICEHNHRSTVKVWGVVFKDPATAAIAVHVMQGYDTPAFLQAYTRFSSRYGHPSKMFIDEGSQLMKACAKMEINIVDLTQTLNSQYQVGVEYQTCPVGGHNAHGIVERSIREVRKLFNLLYHGLRLDIMTYETAFVSISNELNNLPICLGSRTSNLEHSDLITPSRLILGRNNRRALGGYARIEGPSRLMEQMENVYRAWWQVWNDERLLDYIPQPGKWAESNGDIKVGDLVIFLKTDKDQTLGDPIWKMGRVKELENSSDGLPRTAIVEYKNSTETVFRTTRRSVRKIAVLHREGDLDLVQELNEASRRVNVCFTLKCLK